MNIFGANVSVKYLGKEIKKEKKEIGLCSETTESRMSQFEAELTDDSLAESKIEEKVRRMFPTVGDLSSHPLMKK